jgi:AraC-like DNA-binding protein
VSSFCRAIIFESGRLVVGKYCCPADHPLWSVENRIGPYPTIAFPRVAVSIKQADRYPVVATPNHVVLYNAHHPYHRQLLDPRGDECEFVSISGPLLDEIVEAAGHHGRQVRQGPFQVSHAPCPSSVYLRQRAVFEQIRSASGMDPLYAEEQYLLLVEEVMRSALNFRTAERQPAAVTSRHREQVAAARRFLARYYCEPLRIEDVAVAADSSDFHLCRIFKRHSGLTVHQFLTQLRLRSSLERLLDTDSSILSIALDLGFTSHSHFTAAFQRSFGLSPAAFRKSPARSIPGR